MENIRWFKRFESHLPKDLNNAKDKFENYARDLGKNMKHAGKVLDEKTDHGLLKYLSLSVPFFGGRKTFKTIAKGKEIAAVEGLSVTYMELGKAGGLLLTAAGNAAGPLAYVIATGFEWAINGAYDIS